MGGKRVPDVRGLRVSAAYHAMRQLSVGECIARLGQAVGIIKEQEEIRKGKASEMRLIFSRNQVTRLLLFV